TIMEAAERLGWTLDGETTVDIQGFGQVGGAAFREIEKLKCRVVAVSDVTGGVYNLQGMRYDDLKKYVDLNKGLKGCPMGDAVTNEEILILPCDILIPAATGGVITKDNAKKLKCRMIAEGANGPTTSEADHIINERGDIFVIPDVLANAGG